MAKDRYVSTPSTDINGETPSNIKNWVYASDAGKVSFISPTPGKSIPVLQIGGEDHEIIATSSNVTDGTIDKIYYKEGVRTNPLSLFPSSFFTPIPPQIHSLMPGPLSVISNPNLLIAIITIVAAADKESDNDSYSHNKITLPVKVIDNQELEDKLFAER